MVLRRLSRIALSVLVPLAACQEAPILSRTGQATDAFREVSQVVLDSSVVATMGRIRAFLPLADQLLVADGMTERVLAFAPDGSFKGAIGRHGDGPGEFRSPHSLLEAPDGTILVADATPRLTRFSPTLEVLGVYRVDVPVIVGGLALIRDDVVLFQWARDVEGDNFVLWDPERGLGASFDPRSQLVLSVPYWNAAWTTLLAVGPRQLFVADNMVYPLRRYTIDRELIDSVGSAPPSWRQATKPDYGEFATLEGQRRAWEWLRSFTVIDGLHTLGEDWLIVSHRERINQYRTDDIIRADVYRVDGQVRKVWEDIRLPGPVLRGGDCAWVVVAQPPDPWTVACWSPRLLNGAP